MMRAVKQNREDEIALEGKLLPQIAYLIITVGCLFAAVTLWISGYHGYSGLLFAIGLAAAINLKLKR